MEILDQYRRNARNFGQQPLLVTAQGKTLDLKSGYIPLLSTFTHEDKAAKGLRKGRTIADENVPVYYTALELVRDNQVLLLHGESGSGKTTFGKHLCHRIVTEIPTQPTPVLRNELGQIEDEIWDATDLLPCYFAIDDAHTLGKVTHQTIPNIIRSVSGTSIKGIMFVLDGIDHGKDHAVMLIDALVAQIEDTHNTHHRLVLLADDRTLSSSGLGSAVPKHSLSPLLKAQRRLKLSTILHLEESHVNVALGQGAANPAIFALALRAGTSGDNAETVVDQWLSVDTEGPEHIRRLERHALRHVYKDLGLSHDLDRDFRDESPLQLATSSKVQSLLAARYLVSLRPTDTATLLQYDSVAALGVVRDVLMRLRGTPDFLIWATEMLAQAESAAQRTAILIAEHDVSSDRIHHQVVQLLLAIISNVNVFRAMLLDAGSALSRLGDPRDLTSLVDVPAGRVTMGSSTHANSQPLHEVVLQSFKIGKFPVTTREYAQFVAMTSRSWSSPDQTLSHRQNVPATDLTWFDAVAYCQWLTQQWQDSARISSNERVRLPTEPEWERASRGDLRPSDSDDSIYPWGTSWQEDSCNSEETGLNQTCCVGLFSKGISPYGCYDMAGNVWEWCTTLWGDDMSAPSFRYPWQDDDRENLTAPSTIRRVLRGGCFSSGKLKANCTYRGSLEPNGFWRGNGFRIVVASHD